ncbi:MAG: SRPBCC family protein [Alphaproteobacteria bacterium]|nr:SRPBCC family protein [Alphaproteobacteria bacterium]
MASLHKEIVIDAPAAHVWDAVRDVGAVHRRFVPGLVVDTRLSGGSRVVTFANGTVLHELIVSIDDARRRLAYAAVGGASTHHNASFQVFAEGEMRSRLVWITDVLPEAMVAAIEPVQDRGLAIMKRTLETALT